MDACIAADTAFIAGLIASGAVQSGVVDAMIDMSKAASETVRTLSAAGWFPGRRVVGSSGRRVDVSGWCAQLQDEGYVVNDAARGFLAEFGGLSVPHMGSGITRARAQFDFLLDDTAGEDDRFLGWSERVGEVITPIGGVDEYRYLLGIGESWTFYRVIDWLASFGQGLTGLEGVVLGVMPEDVG